MVQMWKFKFGIQLVKNLLDQSQGAITEEVFAHSYAMISLGDKPLITWQDG